MRFKSFGPLRKEFEKRLKRSVRRSVLQEIADTTAVRIKKRARLGYAVEKDGAKRKKHKPLKASTVRTRRWAKKRNILSTLTTPKRSNLTYTGQLLDSIQGKVAGRKAIVYVKNKRRKILNESKVPTNSQVIKWLEEVGRPFFYLSNIELKAVQKIIRDSLKKNLKF